MKKDPSFSLTWDLSTLSSGENRSALEAAIHHVKHQIQHFARKFKQLSDLKTGILHFQELEGRCQDLQYFVDCLLAQNVEDQAAVQCNSQIATLRASCESLGEELNALLAELDEETFASLLSDMEEIAFHLQERRQRSRDKLPVAQEHLVHQLEIDGYQGWHEIYNTFLGQLRIPSPLQPEETLSVGQAYNRLTHPDRSIRQAWFQRWEETWTMHEALLAQMLNHLAGFRINLYAARKWPSILQEPLFYNRMQEKTLTTMWSVIDDHKTCLHQYLSCKARILGVEKLAWLDVEAPLPFDAHTTIPFQEAAQLIIQHFTAFSPAMGAFAEQAFEKRWIEAEDRSGKQQGGFCAPFMHDKQSRIFMTYSGTMMNVFTLAHELGHAYHSYEVRNLPIFAQNYRMNVAETASTLAEMVMVDAMIQQASDGQARLALLDQKLQRAILFLMNIQARFLFELDFYQARRKGFVLASELNLFMENAQKKAFGNALAQWHPHFWVPKQHFYVTEVPFYNFPYTFGYLFSQGIYAHFKGRQDAGEAYAQLLQDTGRMTVEELAQRHLGVNLEERPFWEKALRLIEEDVVTYLKIKENSAIMANASPKDK